MVCLVSTFDNGRIPAVRSRDPLDPVLHVVLVSNGGDESGGADGGASACTWDDEEHAWVMLALFDELMRQAEEVCVARQDATGALRRREMTFVAQTQKLLVGGGADVVATASKPSHNASVNALVCVQTQRQGRIYALAAARW